MRRPWWNPLMWSRRTRAGRPAAGRARPALEPLEDRWVPTVTYHGGPLLPSVEATALFFGSAWSSTPSLSQQAVTLDNYLQYLVNSPYMDMLTNAGYGVGRGQFVGS